MKKKLLWMYAAILACSMSLTSCEGLVDAVIGSEDQATGEDQTPGQEEPTVQEWLAKIPGVSDIEVRTTTVTEENPTQYTYYYFFFDQKVDHNDPTKGTFKQRVVLRYKDKNAVNVLHTQGYVTTDKPDDLGVPTLADIFNGNMIEIEYRYFGYSLPEPFENLEFNYLYSSQASEDYHAILTALKASGQFQGQWVATGTSKSGIATALYAYYSGKKGYNDVDIYVPFCAPFCEKVDDPRIGNYMIQKSLASSSYQKELLMNIDRCIVSGTALSTYLVSEYKKAYPDYVQSLRDERYTEEQVVATILANYITLSRANLFDKLAYLPIDYFRDYIPDATDESQLEYTKFFLEKPLKDFEKYIKDHPKAGTREKSQGELLKMRKEDAKFPYNIQAMLELGYFLYDYSDLQPWCALTTLDFIKQSDEGTYKDYDPTYTSRFSNAMTLDFINNFLPTTTMPMIFVYGENDPWTGCAIPDPTNPNIVKIIIPKGVHSDFIDLESYCPKATCQQIKNAISKYIQF